MTGLGGTIAHDRCFLPSHIGCSKRLHCHHSKVASVELWIPLTASQPPDCTDLSRFGRWSLFGQPGVRIIRLTPVFNCIYSSIHGQKTSPKPRRHNLSNQRPRPARSEATPEGRIWPDAGRAALDGVAVSSHRRSSCPLPLFGTGFLVPGGLGLDHLLPVGPFAASRCGLRSGRHRSESRPARGRSAVARRTAGPAGYPRPVWAGSAARHQEHGADRQDDQAALRHAGDVRLHHWCSYVRCGYLRRQRHRPFTSSCLALPEGRLRYL